MRVRTIEKAEQAVNFYKKLGYHLAYKIEIPWGLYDINGKRLITSAPMRLLSLST